ncbi:MAG TPA: PLP-dependent aminotransferase family protein, partial [Jatrophihabitans sp.]|uniref:aminotransferase class I/II-fold pyridoxal phosphate-dependent enzyme n=1 Tax=Jatrophihabitans sp. TaxID=1932789 RepID=UPI002EEAE43E
MSATTDRLRPGELSASQLFGALQDPALNSMNFLNEISHRYPDAVSLAAGRPVEEFFEVEAIEGYLRRFCLHLKQDLGYSEEEVRRTLFQYGRTKGIVHGLIAANLAQDEGISVDPESIVVTVGCQEAMFLVLRALRGSASDVLLAVTPTYVGLTGAARLVEMPVLPVAAAPGGVNLDDLQHQLRQARAAGLRPRACYVMPDFANPSGVSMDLDDRRRLLAIAEAEGILLLEDNPYGLFSHADDRRRPTLKALDEHRSVVYLGSFAKTAMPGARVGYLVADQPVVDAAGNRSLFADELSKIKSMLTVNTSPIAQAVVGGKLLENDCSLLAANERERAVYARNMRLMVEGLAKRFPDPELGVRFNVPVGGFFVVVTVPFGVDDSLLERSAADYGVL